MKYCQLNVMFSDIEIPHKLKIYLITFLSYFGRNIKAAAVVTFITFGTTLLLSFHS